MSTLYLNGERRLSRKGAPALAGIGIMRALARRTVEEAVEPQMQLYSLIEEVDLRTDSNTAPDHIVVTDIIEIFERRAGFDRKLEFFGAESNLHQKRRRS